jgi:hypothetical protein
MSAERFFGAVAVLCFVLALGACSPFSGYVADSWPHWAGGEPVGLPPRPGKPGYADYIAHGQPAQDPQPASGGAERPAVDETTQVASQRPTGTVQKTSIFGGPQVAAPRSSPQPSAAPNTRPGAQAAPGSGGAGEDGSVLRGGLY